MLYALAIAALTAVPSQGGDLKLANVRMTLGDLGPTRPDAKFLPGDALHVRFDMTGISIEASGEAKYKMESRVRDKNNKVIFKKDAEEKSAFAPLRGNSVPGAALILIGLDMDAGEYVLEVSVEDPKTKATDSKSVKFEVLKKDFGIVAVHATADFQGFIPTSNVGTVGQTIIIWYTVASFERDAKTKQPKIELQIQLLDEKGTPTLKDPLKHVQDGGVDEKIGAISPYYSLFLNRPGKFTVRITAIDQVSNKKASYDWPVTVLSQN
jgi:hypothetical protein